MKRIDRRALFASGAAAALLAATGVGASQRRGGVLRLALPRADNLLERIARATVFERLTEIGPDGLLRGELAKAWVSDADARVWEFEMRSDARFHDGSAVLNSDVARSLERRAAALERIGVSSIQSVHQTSVQITLEIGDPHLPYHLASEDLFVSKSQAVELKSADWNGSGIYRVERAPDARQFRLARSPSHPNDGRLGWFDAVEALVIPDSQVRADALKNGYVDLAVEPEAHGLGGVRFYPSEDHIELAYCDDLTKPARVSDRAPLDDLRIAHRWWMA